jgi:NAD(P)-dependent dehydrogenase (short-subunit alcohol dehydrogenase family)
VANRASVEQAASRVLERHPRADLLVNNAGVPGRGTFLSLTPEQIETVLVTNYLGGVWCTRAFLPGLGRGAHVVNVVSVAGTVSLSATGPYAASKHAQLAFSRALAGELTPRGVQVHSVLPGFVETEGFPQRQRVGDRLYRLVVGPELVATRLADAVEQGKREVFVPRWYRLFTVAQAVAPSLIARVAARL